MANTDADSADDVTAVVTDAPLAVERLGLAKGEQLGRYVILSELGAGGMGLVYRAYDPKLHREVALKRLKTNALDRAAEARLQREAQAMAQLNHPNVVGVFDVDVDDTGVVISMEYVAGRTLNEWVRDGRPWREVVLGFIDAGRGLSAAHAAGLAHRDFKPANVLVAEDGRIKVTDFGLAKGLAVDGPLSEPPDASGPPSPSGGRDCGPDVSESLEGPLTVADTVMGTPRYMAPEQHVARDADARSDQYAFCVALWEALNGEPPFRAKREALIVEKLEGPPPWPADSPAPRRVVRAIERGLSVKPSGRWPSMDALLEELSFDPSRQRQARIRIATATIVVLGSVGGAYAWVDHRGNLCAADDERLAALWNATAREQAMQAFRRSNRRSAELAWSNVAAGIDGYATRWSEMSEEACEATRVRGEQSAEVLQRREACLEVALRGWGATVRAVVDAEPADVDHAQRLLRGLPSVAHCGNIEALQEDPGTAADAQQRASTDIQDEIAELRVRLALERFEPLPRDAPGAGLLERVDGLQQPSLRAEVELLEGRRLAGAHDREHAERHFDEALGLSLEHGPPRLALASALALAEYLAVDPDRRSETEWLCRLALGTARRLDTNGPAEVAVLVVLARTATANGDTKEAARGLARALEMARGRGDMQAQTDVLVRVAAVHARAGDAELAAATTQDARATTAAHYGPGHPEQARALASIGRAMLAGGLDGLPVMREALEMLDDAGWGASVDAGQLHSDRARGLEGAGRTEDGAKAHVVAVEILTAALGRSHPITLDALAAQAASETSRDPKAAQTIYRELLEHEENRHGTEDVRYVDTLVAMARAERALEDPDAALRTLTQARALVGKVEASTALQLEITLSLAEAYQVRRDSDGVQRLVEEAQALAGASQPGDAVLERLARLAQLAP